MSTITKPKKKLVWGAFDAKNQQHKYILSLCQQLGWTRPHTKYGSVADLGRLGRWLASEKSPVRKPLTRMEPKDLSKIISALESMIQKEYKKITYNENPTPQLS